MLRSTQIVTIMSFLTLAVGFVRTAIIAYFLGVSSTVDAYNISLIAPSLFCTIFIGLLQSSFIGQYSLYTGVGENEQAAAYRTRSLIFVVITSFLAALLCAIFPREIINSLIPADQTELISLSIQSLRITSINILLLSVADFIGLILNCHRKFFWPTAASLINALASSVSIYMWKEPDIIALASTLIIGSLCQFLFIYTIFTANHLRYRLRYVSSSNVVRRTMISALPVLPALAMANSAGAIIQVHMADVGEGAVSVFGYASRLHAAVSQFLVVGLSTVLLPHVADLLSRNEHDKVNSLYRRLVKICVLLTLAISLGIALLGQDTVSILLGRGKFSEQYALWVSYMWTILGAALMPITIGTFVAKIAQAQRRSLAIFFSGTVSLLVTWLVATTGSSLDNMYFVALATPAAMFAGFTFWMLWFIRTEMSKGVLSAFGNSVWRSFIILIPVFLVDYAIRLIGIQNIFMDFFVRGFIFLCTTLVVIFGLGFHRWFLDYSDEKARNTRSART